MPMKALLRGKALSALKKACLWRFLAAGSVDVRGFRICCLRHQPPCAVKGSRHHFIVFGSAATPRPPKQGGTARTADDGAFFREAHWAVVAHPQHTTHHTHGAHARLARKVVLLSLLVRWTVHPPCPAQFLQSLPWLQSFGESDGSLDSEQDEECFERCHDDYLWL